MVKISIRNLDIAAAFDKPDVGNVGDQIERIFEPLPVQWARCNERVGIDAAKDRIVFGQKLVFERLA